jgi:hypothetical protein
MSLRRAFRALWDENVAPSGLSVEMAIAMAACDDHPKGRFALRVLLRVLERARAAERRVIWIRR